MAKVSLEIVEDLIKKCLEPLTQEITSINSKLQSIDDKLKNLENNQRADASNKIYKQQQLPPSLAKRGLAIVYCSVQSISLGIKPDIDLIIEKLLSSDKIDILIDRIADRAAEKIKSQMKKETKDRQSEHRYSGNKENRANVLWNDEGNSKLKETSITTRYPKPVQRIGFRGQPGKIDNQAAREKYASFPYELLSLKYNKLISKDGRVRDASTNTERIKQNYEDQNNFETLVFNKPKGPERIKIKEEKQYKFIKLNSEEKKSEDFDFSSDNHKELKSKHFIEKENSKEKPFYEKMKNNNDDFRLEKQSAYFSDNNFRSRSAEQRRSQQIMPDSLNKGSKSKGMRLFRSKDASVDQEANDDFLDDNEQDDGTVEVKEEESKIILRKDGDRVFAVENAPEYKEYNDNLKKMSDL